MEEIQTLFKEIIAEFMNNGLETYIVIAINYKVCKDVLGMWGGENEIVKFWVGVLNSMKNRDVEDAHCLHRQPHGLICWSFLIAK